MVVITIILATEAGGSKAILNTSRVVSSQQITFYAKPYITRYYIENE